MSEIFNRFRRSRGVEQPPPDSLASGNEQSIIPDKGALEVNINQEEIGNARLSPTSSDEKESPNEFNDEKRDPEVAVHSSHTTVDEDPADVEADLRDIPITVRKIVSLEDDPTLPTITFRYFVLAILFVVPGAFLSQLGTYRTVSSPYSVFFVQIASHYCGVWLAKVLPSKTLSIPFTGFKFSLNPGPWSIKEHVLVTITAASGANSNLASTPISMAQLYYGDSIHPAAAIFFMYSIVFLGYSLAAVARQFLLYDPIYPWPQALMQTTLFETFRKSSEDSKLGRKQKHVFFACLGGIILWQFLPEYIFPMLGSLAFLCWVAPNNADANFVGAGLGGMGFLNLSLDWANISNLVNPMIVPFWTSCITFAAFVFSCWVLLPIAKWGKFGEYKHGLMSNRLLTANGTRYPVTDVMGPDYSFNQTAYEEIGPIYMGTQMIWSLFFDYASYTSAFTWMMLFGWPQIRATWKKLRNRMKTRGAESINYQYSDRLNVIQRSYQEVPLWWYVVLFLCTFITTITILAKGVFFIPLWTYFIALLTGLVVVIPMGWLYAISNFQVPIGSFNELLYGYMVNSSPGHRHPAGASTYGSIAGDAWYRAQTMLQDQKIGHYMHIPPRAVFFSQVFGQLIGIPINYGTIQWVLQAKGPYLTGEVEDPLHVWTGQSLASYNTLGVQYVLVGPARLFSQHIYQPLPWSFLFGALAPFLVYGLHRLFPHAKFHLWNVTIFSSAMSTFYGNLSTGYTSAFIIAAVSMRWLFRNRFEFWRRYNYLVAAAFDAGFNFNMLLIFLFFGAGKVVTMPRWWGNDEKSVERCFALES